MQSFDRTDFDAKAAPTDRVVDQSGGLSAQPGVACARWLENTLNKGNNKEIVMTGYIAYLKTLTEPELDTEIDRKITDTYDELLETEEVSGCITNTNAASWGVDDYDIADMDIDDECCEVRLNFCAAGEQEDEQMFYGDRLHGVATVLINDGGDVEYTEVSASLD